jgi:hypothetical protein
MELVLGLVDPARLLKIPRKAEPDFDFFASRHPEPDQTVVLLDGTVAIAENRQKPGERTGPLHTTG